MGKFSAVMSVLVLFLALIGSCKAAHHRHHAKSPAPAESPAQMTVSPSKSPESDLPTTPPPSSPSSSSSSPLLSPEASADADAPMALGSPLKSFSRVPAAAPTIGKSSAASLTLFSNMFFAGAAFLGSVAFLL